MKFVKALLFMLGCAALAGCAGTPKQAPDPRSTDELDSWPFAKVLAVAKTGNVAAIHQACFSYMYGRNGAKQNEDRAYEWCTRGHEKGAQPSTTLLAEILYYGSEKRRDRKRARELYQIAAADGHVFATYMVGYLMLENGEDREEARAWIQLAASKGLDHAIKLLDQMDIEDRSAPPAH
jgi:TPR repeat protein